MGISEGNGSFGQCGLNKHDGKLNGGQFDVDVNGTCYETETPESHREWGSSEATRGGGTPVTKLFDSTKLGVIAPESQLEVDDVVSGCASGVVKVVIELTSLPTDHIDDSLCEYNARKESQ